MMNGFDERNRVSDGWEVQALVAVAFLATGFVVCVMFGAVLFSHWMGWQ